MIYRQKIYNYLIILWPVFFSSVLFASPGRVDSLKAVLKTAVADSTKVQLLQQLFQATDSVHYSVEALGIAQKIGYRRGIAQSLCDIGGHYYFEQKPDIALSDLSQSVQMAKDIGDKRILADAYIYIGYIYRPNDPYVAEDYYNKSLKLSEETGYEISSSYALSALGNVYEKIYEGNSQSNRKALGYYLKSLAIRERIGSYEEIAASLNETSREYDLLGIHNKGLELRLRGLKYAEKAGSLENIAYLSNVLGNEYSLRLHKFKKGLEYHLKAYENAKKLTNNYDLLYDITKGIAFDYRTLGDLIKSNKFYAEAIVLNDSVHAIKTRHDYNLSGLKHNMEIELDKQKLLLKDSEIEKQKAEAARQVILRNTSLIGFVLILLLALIVYRGNREKQRSNRELEIKNRKIESAYKILAVSENKFKLITETIDDVFYLYNIPDKKYEYISPNCGIMFGLSQEFIYSRNTMKSVVFSDDLPLVIDANVKVDSGIPYNIEYRVVVNDEIKWIAEKSSPIYDEGGKLVRNSGICIDITQRKSDEENLRARNQDIRDSILYASTIQKAMLVPREKIAKRINEFFILSKPKDIVSGDFYFYRETENGMVIAVVDCTGHGVPGGFMSMLGSAFLNEIVNNNNTLTPAQILDKLGRRIIKSLHQNIGYASNKDGMDIAMLSIENNNPVIQYAGAFNPLYIVRNGELVEVPADKFPIGINFGSEPNQFTNNNIELKKGDSVYLFSDGYTDQFGGPQSKKFMKKQFQDLLLSIQDKSMNEQGKILDKTFMAWKGNMIQTDDVMVFGMKIDFPFLV
ncbi:MAG: SpoIIE family protein phosphatase [Bacteroidia bacterium]